MGSSQRTILRFAVPLAFLAAAIPAKAQTSQLAFSGAREDYQYGGAFAIGDFNGDGFPDIVTSDPSGAVVVLLNDGTGHFNKTASLAVSSAQYFVSGDFNNDGLLDVAFAAYNGIYIALGNGDGTLRNLFQLSNVSGGNLQAVDLNNDGNLDLVIGGVNATASYCLGYGDGTLQTPISFGGVTGPVAIIDVNGDKKPDILGISQNSVQVELNAGNGTFLLGPKTQTLNGYVQALAAGDIDGNGAADLIVATTSPNLLTTFKGDGHGNFALSSSIALPLQTSDVVLLDVDGDGKLDLLYDRIPGSQVPATNLVLQLGTGNGSFGPAIHYATAGANNRIVLADTRKSGKRDLLTGGGSYFSVLMNQGDDTFKQGSYFKLPGVLQSSVAGDFNHDGIPDLLVSVRLSVGAQQSSQDDSLNGNSQFAGAYVLLGTGNPAVPFRVRQRLYIPPDVLKVATGDFNNDGTPDVAFVTGKDLVIYMGVGDGTFTLGSQYPCICSTLVVGDLNGDGNADIATSGVYLFLGKGDGTFGPPSIPFVGGNGFIEVGDFNTDGKLDLVTSQSNSGGILTALGKGDGTFSLVASPGIYGVTAGAVADFNGDGLPDLALLSGSYLYMYLNAGSGLFIEKSYMNTSFGSTANTIAAADFNHDGKMDLAVPGVDMLIYTGAGDGTFAPQRSFGSANYANVILADDFFDFGHRHLPDLIGIGQNGAISTLINESH